MTESRSKHEIMQKVEELEILRKASEGNSIERMKLLSMEIALEWAANARNEIPEVML